MKRKFAVFDIDGTLYRNVFHHVVIDEMEAEGLIPEEYVKKIQQERKNWKHRKHPEAFWDYVEAQNDYFLEQLETINPADFKRLAEKIVSKQKKYVYTYTSELLKKMQAEKRVIIAISGSAETVIKPFTDFWGFDISVAAEYQVKNGKYTGEQTATYMNKHITLERLVRENDLTWDDSLAVGDTNRDASLLEAVKNPIAFNPEQALYDEAKKRDWKIVVERKNVIYELEPGNGKYILA